MSQDHQLSLDEIEKWLLLNSVGTRIQGLQKQEPLSTVTKSILADLKKLQRKIDEA